MRLMHIAGWFLITGCAEPGRPQWDRDTGAEPYPDVIVEAPPRDVAVVDVGVTEAATPYAEALCNAQSPLDDIEANFVDTPTGVRQALTGIATRRYPMAFAVLDVASDTQIANWVGPSAHFDDVLTRFDTGVREATLTWSAERAGPTQTFRLRDDLVITVRAIQDFPRRAILPLHADLGADPYADGYLSGAAGEQGLDSILHDYVAYTHALAARYCTREALAPGVRVDLRDRLLTTMYYLELYLMSARTRSPQVYAAILGDSARLRLIRMTWDRGDFWIHITRNHAELAVRDTEVMRWAYGASALLELSRLPL